MQYFQFRYFQFQNLQLAENVPTNANLSIWTMYSMTKINKIFLCIPLMKYHCNDISTIAFGILCSHEIRAYIKCAPNIVLKAFFWLLINILMKNMPWNANSSNNSRISRTSLHRHHITYYCIVRGATSSQSHSTPTKRRKKSFTFFRMQWIKFSTPIIST